MSLTKRIMEEPPWVLDDKKVCGKCFGENGISSYIESHGDRKSCDFCANSQTRED